MKRKVVKHGPSSLIISLPSNWAKLWSVKQGDQLEVMAQGSKLIISVDKEKEYGETETDLSSLDRTSIILMIRNLYRRGYKRIRCNFKKAKATHFRSGTDIPVITTIHEEVNRLIGMEVIEQKNNIVVISEITESSGREFEQLFRKIFHFLQDAFTIMNSSLRTGSLDDLRAIEESHDTITKFVSYCIRLINQGKIPQQENAQQYSQILLLAELVIDLLKYFERDVIYSRHSFSKKNISLFYDLEVLMSAIPQIIFDYDHSIIKDFMAKRDVFKRKVKEYIKQGDTDMIYVNNLTPLIEIIKMMAEVKLSLIS
jgi:phosphate uptake regulator